MSREIRCVSCNLLLGEIRDARLRTNIIYMCEDCHSDLITKAPSNKPDDEAMYDFGSVFNEIFKKK